MHHHQELEHQEQVALDISHRTLDHQEQAALDIQKHHHEHNKTEALLRLPMHRGQM